MNEKEAMVIHRLIGETISPLEKENLSQLNEIKKLKMENERLRGLAERVLYDYAWYKDGIMYVGCGIKTYKKAKEELQQVLKEDK